MYTMVCCYARSTIRYRYRGSPLFGRAQDDGAPLTVVHGHRASVVQQEYFGILAVAHDKLLAADRAGRLVRRATDHVFHHVVRGVQVFAFHPAAHNNIIVVTRRLEFAGEKCARGGVWFSFEKNDLKKEAVQG